MQQKPGQADQQCQPLRSEKRLVPFYQSLHLPHLYILYVSLGHILDINGTVKNVELELMQSIMNVTVYLINSNKVQNQRRGGIKISHGNLRSECLH